MEIKILPHLFERSNLGRKAFKSLCNLQKIGVHECITVMPVRRTIYDANVCYRINRWRVGPHVCTCPHDINRPTQMHRGDATKICSNFAVELLLISYHIHFVFGTRWVKTTWYLQIWYLRVICVWKNILRCLRLFSNVASATFTRASIS